MKKLIASALALALLFSLFCPTLATGANDAGEALQTNVPTDHEVREYALNFMCNSQSNDDLVIDDFIHLTNGNAHITGYYVTFLNEGTPAGYILLSLISGENPVVEFALEGPGILEAETSTMTLTSNSVGNQEIVYAGPGQLYVPTGVNTYYSVYDHDNISISASMLDEISVATTLTPLSDITIGDGMIDWDDNAGVINDEVFKIQDFGIGSDYWLMTDFSTGSVCAPTAATNVLWYWGKMRGRASIMDQVSDYATDEEKARALYDILYDEMGTSETTGTKMLDIIKGYKGFFEIASANDAWDYSIIPNGTTFYWYQDLFTNECPIHLSLFTESEWGPSGDGHSVMAIGHATSTNGAEYILVMDGWHRYGRFVKFDYYPYLYGRLIDVEE